MIRAPGPREVRLLPQIENDGDRRYLRAGLPMVLAMPPAKVEALEAGRRDGRLWVAASPTGRLLGFALMKQLHGRAWLDQLSVAERWQGRGVGTALVEHTVAIARARGHAVLYLSTYADVPWNAPWYRRRGFASLPRAEWPFRFRLQFAIENGHGHPPWRRTIMGRSLGGDA